MTDREMGQPNSKIESRYYHVGEKLDCSFYRLPKVLFLDERYKDISTDAKMLYALLLDRMELSAINGWEDEQHRVYLYFTVEEVCSLLKFGESKITKLFREIEKIGLIERRQQGLCKASVIYPKIPENVRASKSRLRSRKKQGSETVKNKVPEPRNSRGNNTEYNNTEYSDTYISISDDDWEQTYRRVKEQIEYDILSQRREYSKLDEIVEIITEIMCISSPTIRIGKNEYPAGYVKERFSKLDSLHMEYVHDCLRECTVKIKDIKAYLVSALFNAPATMGHYYQAEVNYDSKC